MRANRVPLSPSGSKRTTEGTGAAILALSFHQPYASLIAAGYKSFSAKGFMPLHPRWVAIYAPKMGLVRRRDKGDLNWDITLLLIKAGIPNWRSLPRGKIVCVAWLEEVFPRAVIENKLGERERMLLEEQGEYVFWLRRPIRLPVPIPVTTRAKTWEWEPPPTLARLLER